MPCYHPVTAYRSKQGRNPDTGKWPLVFNYRDGYIDMVQKVPCGRCIGCRLDKSRQWAIRCIHEASLYKKNCFITLTYNDENLPDNGNLDKRHFVLFMKKLRKKYGEGIRFFHCGEYGSKLKRPHHHACLFNHDFEDKKHYSTRRQVKLYRSNELENLWKYGFSTIGDVTFESAAYVARYILKKMTGELAEDHYSSIDMETGEVIKIEPEYVTMSRRPGIGKGWFDKFKDDVYPEDRVVVRNNFMCKPPRYYDNLYDIDNSSQMKKIRGRRQNGFKPEENTFERLEEKEIVKLSQTKNLVRDLEGN